jgi:hypothetical protein
MYNLMHLLTSTDLLDQISGVIWSGRPVLANEHHENMLQIVGQLYLNQRKSVGQLDSATS